MSLVERLQNLIVDERKVAKKNREEHFLGELKRDQGQGACDQKRKYMTPALAAMAIIQR